MDVMDRIETVMTELASGIATAHGAAASVDFRTIFHPVGNDVAASRIAAEVCDELVGPEKEGCQLQCQFRLFLVEMIFTA